MSAHATYRFHRYRRLDKYPAIRAAQAAQTAVLKWLERCNPAPLLRDAAMQHAAQMQRALITGFAHAPGTQARHSAHRRAWHAAHTLELLVNRGAGQARSREFAVVQRALDRADILISGLPGVELSD